MKSPQLMELDPARPPLRWLLRLPRHLYRANLGWLLGQRFLQLTTRGRTTGAPRAVVLEVLGLEAEGGGFFIASAWGAGAQWLRNLEASPRAEVQVGRQRFSAEVERLSEEAGEVQVRRYAVHHPLAYRLFIGPLLLGHRPDGDVEEFAELGRTIPILVVRPVGGETRPAPFHPFTPARSVGSPPAAGAARPGSRGERSRSAPRRARAGSCRGD